MKKIMKGLVLSTFALNSFAALAANLVLEKTVKFQKDPAAYLKEFSENNQLPEGSLYLAANLSSDAWVTAMTIFSGNEFVDALDLEGGTMTIFRLDDANSKKITLSKFVGLTSPFSQTGHVKFDAFVSTSDGRILKFKLHPSPQRSQADVKTLSLDLAAQE